MLPAAQRWGGGPPEGWWRGGDVASWPLRQRFALPPPHGFATGRIHDSLRRLRRRIVGVADGPRGIPGLRLVGRPFGAVPDPLDEIGVRSEEHTSELPSLMRNSYAVFCLK